jgi:hypothetical protein
MAKKAATKTAAADVYPPTLLVFHDKDTGGKHVEWPDSRADEEGHIEDWSCDSDITHYEKFHLTLVETGTRGPVFTVKKAGV